MPIDLPDPGDPDVWGQELNTAIESIDSKAEAAAAAAATNVAVEGVDPVDGGLDITYGENTASLIRVEARGAINGVASLDGGGRVPVSQLGNLSYVDVGAAPVVHQHSLSDLPQVSLAVNVAPVIAVFNTTTQQWPALTTLTSSPTRPIIWVGDADIPTYARPGVDFFYGPRKSGTTTTTPTPPDPPSTSFDANGVALSQPVVTVSGSTYNITATVQTNANVTFTFLQLAVRGPNGEAQDTGYNSGANINTTTQTITGTGSATALGTWTVRLSYNLTGGADQSNWVDGVTRSFVISDLGGVPTQPGTGTPGSGLVPVLGRSGKAWNSGVWVGGNSVSAAQQFFDWRGSQGDSVMAFVPRGGTDFNTFMYFPADIQAFPGYRVMAMPTQPEGLNNAYTASGQANAFWLEYGKQLKNRGWDDGRTILRLNWEANGNWYAWAWMNGGAATFVQAWKNVVNQVRVNAPKTKFDLCLNRGNVNGGINWQTQIADPLIGYLDMICIDMYDFAPPSFNDSDFNANMNANPGPNPIFAYCRAKGLKSGFDEWGSASGTGGYAGGGDNPFYIQKMYNMFAANADVMANEMYFNYSADNLFQMLYPNTNKPIAAAKYRELF